MEAKTDSLQRLAQMTRGIGDGAGATPAAVAAAGPPDGASSHFDCAPSGALAAAGFVKLEDTHLIKSEEPLEIDPLKGVSLSAAAACAVAAAADSTLYQPAGSAGPAAVGFQPAWPNFYYQQLAHSSAAAFNAAAMCSWPGAAQPPPSAVHCGANAFPSYAANPSKKGRQTYTRQQTMQLEDRFRENKYVTRKLRDQLRAATDLNDRQIKIWFQNRRMKEKKENQRRDNSENEHTPLTANPPPGSAAAAVKMVAMLPTAAECAAAAAANVMLHNHHPPSASDAHSMQHGQMAPHQQHLMAAAAAGEMSPVSLHKNLVSLSLNGGNGVDGSFLSTGDAAMTSSAASSAVATAAVANFAAGLAGGLPHHHSGLFNAHNQMHHHLQQFDELAGVIEEDKKNMSAFGMIPNPSAQHPMTAAAMWTSINGGGAMMMPAMSTASTPMSSSSGGGSTPFGAAGLTAAMLSGEPALTPWLTPHQLAQNAMPAGMMHAAVASANNNGFGAINGGGGHYAAYSLYPTNV